MVCAKKNWHWHIPFPSTRNHHSKVNCLAATVASRRLAWLPESSERPSSRRECLRLGNELLSSAGRKYLGTPTPSHLSEEADKSVSHEWPSSSTRCSEWRIPAQPFDRQKPSASAPSRSCVFLTQEQSCDLLFFHPVPEGLIVLHCFGQRRKFSPNSSFTRLPRWAKCSGPDEQNVRIPPNARQLRLRHKNKNVFVIISCRSSVGKTPRSGFSWNDDILTRDVNN